MGYETFDFIENMGTSFDMIILYICFIPFIYLLRSIKKRINNKYIKNIYDYLKGVFLYAYILRLIVENYL